MNRRQGGFTLVELLIVMALIGTLTPVVYDMLRDGTVHENVESERRNLLEEAHTLNELLRTDMAQATSLPEKWLVYEADAQTAIIGIAPDTVIVYRVPPESPNALKRVVGEGDRILRRRVITRDLEAESFGVTLPEPGSRLALSWKGTLIKRTQQGFLRQGMQGVATSRAFLPPTPEPVAPGEESLPVDESP